jgi:galactokinase
MHRTPNDPSLLHGQDIAGQLAVATEAFVSRFDRKPKFAAVAPGRVNLIGEHTDYNQGFVLPMAIDRQTLVLADFAETKQSTLWSIDLDESIAIDITLPLAPMPGHFANYVLGVLAQFTELGRAVPNLDAAITSSVPIGAGLSSSAALEVAFATILEQVTGVTLSPIDKALLCQRAEHTFPGAPVGIMDMLTSIRAKAGNALLIDCRTNQSQDVPLPEAHDASVLIIDTKVKHELSGGEYADRRAACEEAAKLLGVDSLRDATPEMLSRAKLPPILHKRALHVVAENTRTTLAAQALAAGDLPAFGGLMFASHESLRDLFEVSCAELDLIVEVADQMRNHGVFGARMTGGGFGGCAVALCQTSQVKPVAAKIRDAFRNHFGRECEPFVVQPSDGAKSLRT